MLGRATLPTSAPPPRRPGPDVPSSPNTDRHLTGFTPTVTGELTAAQLAPVRAVQTRAPRFWQVFTRHEQGGFPRNSGGTVQLVRRQPNPAGQQTAQAVAPTGIFRRGPVPVWTDQFVREL